ncbi:ABC-2 type transport system ATP-binding protein [Gracilibacillus halotolerans]|uniref:ABC-2 type transport system ATP-binding protein n=1 Tax=Gracilibacillus halotolerans TaxID=74386 RepID=A0A841RIF8_9BACI|nr:ABC transporter ATP-binding protein [Gracilibacillus halotolerans]MBB6511266.1 ABC-2 type transport system ATP-binding protein [Gracilibacillus halotolerans]
MIEINKVTKHFEKEQVLDNVQMNIQKGSIYGLLGSNGAGKTTLLKIVAGIIQQDNGEITIEKKAVFENISIKERMIFIPDALYFFSQYTVQQMANFYRNIYSNWNEVRFHQMKKLLDLDVNSKIHRFSKGMQRQVAFWLALCAMPDYLILDEPFDGLDPVIRKKIKTWMIQDVADREMTVVISSHNLREVEDICDSIGILHRGKLMLEKDLDDLKSDIHKVQLAFRDNEPEDLFEGLDVMHSEKRGSVSLYIIKGDYEAIEQIVEDYQPVVFDILPLTLEEIFVYEMEGAGYAIENILL